TAHAMREAPLALIAPAAVHPASHAEQRQTSDEQRQGSRFRHRAGRGRLLHSDRRRSRSRRRRHEFDISEHAITRRTWRRAAESIVNGNELAYLRPGRGIEKNEPRVEYVKRREAAEKRALGDSCPAEIPERAAE